MRLHFQVTGQGPALVILHGLFGSSDNWIPIARKLADSFQVFAVDQRNHGRSPHSPEMNYELMAADLAELMEANNLARAHVLGHSMGGKAAMQFALSHPERVEKLVVADMAPRAYSPANARIYEALLSLDLAAFPSRPAISDALASKIPAVGLRLFLMKMIGRNPDGTFSWQTGLHHLHANSERLRAALPESRPFHGPTLFLRGEKSDFVREGDLPLIHRLFPKATIRTLAGAGHWVHVDSPEPFSRELRAFLRE